MPIEVETPDGIAEFPDGMDSAAIQAALNKHFNPPAAQPSTPENTPLDLTAGGQLLPGGEKAPSGMESGEELTTALAESGQGGIKKTGRFLEKSGKAVRDVAAAYAFEGIGEPELQAKQLGITNEEIQGLGLKPSETGTSETSPIEEGMASLPAALQIPSKATYGLIESAPKLAAVMAAQAVGVPAPIAAGAVFGTTPEGFDPKSAAIAVALPFLGKYSGEIAGVVAKKLGVETTAAINAVKGLAGITGPAAALAAEQEMEIRKLPEDQQHQARIDMWANIAGQSMLGPMGVKFEKARPAEVAGQMLKDNIKSALTKLNPQTERAPNATPERIVEESRQPEYPGTEAQRLPAETSSSDSPQPVAEAQGGQEIRPVPLTPGPTESPQAPPTTLPATMETARKMVEMSPQEFFDNAGTFNRINIEIGKNATPEEYAELKTLKNAADARLSKAMEAAIKTGEKTDVNAAAILSSMPQFYNEAIKAYETKPHYQEIGHGGETAIESRHDTLSGLPPGIPDNGPNFPVELMEASRRLGTLVRSRTTLPQGVGGQYIRARIAQDDRIEVGDIKNQLTVSHEMGHDLDALLWPSSNLAHSQSSLGLRILNAPWKTLRNELLPVSELMRGPITGSPGHQQYRRRATELIADFFALYAHDPTRARQMAPAFSRGFEDALSANPDAQQTIRELHAGNVDPVGPDAGLLPTGQSTGMPGAVPSIPKPAPVARDNELAVAAEDLVKGQVRRFEAEAQKARVRADNWRELVPDKQDRNDVGAFAEGVSNLEIPGDTNADVKARMTPAKKELKKHYSFEMEHQRQRINEYLKGASDGEYLKFLEDYLPHFYANSRSPAGLQAVARFRKESPNAKQRKIPTLREAVDYGLIPISQDPAVLYEATARINWRVATNRKLLSELKGMKSGGDPIVVPKSEAPPGWPVSDNPLIERVYAKQTQAGTLLWRGGAAIHPDAWRAVRMMLETPTSSELGKAYDAINGLTRANAFAFSGFHDITLRSAALGAMGPRGLFRLFERSPITGELKIAQSTRGIGKELLKSEEAVSDAALHGLKFSWNDSESYQHSARNFLDKAAARWRDVPGLGGSLRLAKGIQDWRQQGLWKNTHDALKIAAYNDAVAKALQDSPSDVSSKAVKENIASLMNDAFGGQEWQTKFWMSPQVRQTLARFWLAPDWTLSTLRSVPFVSDIASVVRSQAPRIAGADPIPARGEGLSYKDTETTPTGTQTVTVNNPLYGADKRIKFWGAEIAALAMATVVAQYAIYQAFGKKELGDKPWIWENEVGQNRRIDVTPLMRQLPWRKQDDPTRYYVNLGKRPEEIIGWVTHLDENLKSKMARPVAEVFRQVTGSEGEFKAQWKRDHETFIESLPARAKSAAGTLIPFTFAGNQFALSLPYRKGMSKFKAEQAYEGAYELLAEPNRLRSLLRGQSSNVERVIEQISDAAERNGVPSELVRKRALSSTRGKYYDKYFKAMQKNDEKGMEDAANALGRLGATGKGLHESMRLKMEMQPQTSP